MCSRRRKLPAIAFFAPVFLFPLFSPAGQLRADAAPSEEAQTLLSQQIEARHLAGMAAIVVRAEGVVDVAAAGVRRQGEGAHIQAGDLFHLGSNTKAITATMIARLVEAGKLSFTTTPLDVFPELKNSIHPSFRRITIEQILSHHAGIPPYTQPKEFLAVPAFSGNEVEQRARFAAWVLQRPPALSPGTKGLYSNAGFSIAAAMAERTMGASWGTLVTSLVFEPLGMQAIYGYPLRAGHDQPWNHVETEEGVRAVDQDHAWQVPPYLRPAGDVSIALGDYGRFLSMNLQALTGTESKFLSLATVRRLHASPMQDNYALGWGRSRIAGVPSSTHAGSAGSFYALVALQPSRNVGVAIVANSAGDRTMEAAERVLETLLTKYGIGPR